MNDSLCRGYPHRNEDALHDEGQVLTLSNTLEFFGGKRSYCKSYFRLVMVVWFYGICGDRSLKRCVKIIVFKLIWN